jgi:predicted SnoaL-like aldol condensation-catalyzing enzyme
MSETNQDIVVAFYKKALFEGRVVPTYRQHNPLIEDGMEGMKSSSPGSCQIVRMLAARSSVFLPTATTLYSHWHGLSDNLRGESVVDISLFSRLSAKARSQ